MRNGYFRILIHYNLSFFLSFAVSNFDVLHLFSLCSITTCFNLQ